jgi:hypothetical protein
VHAIHHSSVGPENNRVSEICFEDQPGMICHGPARWNTVAAEPERFVELADLGQRYFARRKIAGEVNEPINIPSQ